MPKELPRHLFQPYRTEQFVAFTYEPQPGWWRRVATYGDLESAQKTADTHSGAGRAVIVCRQEVHYGPMMPVRPAPATTLPAPVGLAGAAGPMEFG